MNLAEITIANFRSYGPATTLRFPVEPGPGGRNVVLVGGMNGAGKTALLDAIRIALYGCRPHEVYRDLNRTEVMRGRESAEFALRIETDDGETISVVRRFEFAQRQGSGSRDGGTTSLFVGRGERSPEPMHNDVWLSEIETLVPREISQFFFFDGEQVQQFASDDVRDTLRRGMETLLGIDLVLRLQSDLKALRDQANREPLVTDADVRVKEAERDRLTQVLRTADERLRDLQSDQDQINAELARIREDFVEHFGPDPEKRRPRELLERERTRLHGKLAEQQQQIKASADSCLAIRMLGDLAHGILEAYQPDQLLSLASDPNLAEHYVEYLTSALTTPNTPCCRSVADDGVLDAIRGRLRDALKGMPNTDPSGRRQPAPIPLSDNDRDRARTRIQDVLDETPATLQAMVRTATELERELAAIETSIGEWERTWSDVGVFDQYQTEIAKLNQRLGRIRTERAAVEDERARASAEIGRIDIELSRLLSQYEDGCQHRAYVAALKDLHALLGEYVGLLRKAKASDVARAVTDMYRRLASKGDRVGRVTIDPDTYAVLIEGPSGDAIERRSLSAGEKEVFAVSLLWGLAQSAHVRLPVVIDTPLSRLDSVHRDRIVTDYLPHASHQVIVLSTDTEVDRQYYRRLSPYISHAMRLTLSTDTGSTAVEEGYFWGG